MSDIIMTNRIVQIHLASWRYFAALTLPPLALMFHLVNNIVGAPLLVLFLTTHYYCWRLYLDEQLFTLLKNEDRLATFDAGMAYLWPNKRIPNRTIVDRWRGVKVLLNRAMASLLMLWMASIWSALFME